MTDSMKFTKLDFFTMKSQLPGYLSLVFIVSLFSIMGSTVILICITSAWFTALMSSNVFIIQEKNNLNRLYGSVSISLKNIVFGRYFISASLLIFTTIVGLQMPLLFKLGYTKAKLWSMIPFIVVMLFISLPSFVSSLSGIVTFMLSHSTFLITICLIASCIIYYFSYHLSVLGYRRHS
ncbi:MAG: hypothetical protein K0R00_4091 [Herbinix sp.]|nr:hypothetical protein [Herbinix sp.]